MPTERVPLLQHPCSWVGDLFICSLVRKGQESAWESLGSLGTWSCLPFVHSLLPGWAQKLTYFLRAMERGWSLEGLDFFFFWLGCYPEGGASSYSGKCCAQSMDRQLGPTGWSRLTQRPSDMEPGLFSASSLSRFPKLYKEVIDLKRRKAQKKKRKKCSTTLFKQSILTVSLVGKSIMD